MVKLVNFMFCIFCHDKNGIKEFYILKSGGGVAEEIEHLPGRHKALSSKPQHCKRYF
jgi:hypothetical protein